MYFDPNSHPEPTADPERRINARIKSAGRITFAEFMEEALYGRGGYYTRPGGPGPINPGGDYFTSPSSHPSFGALIAVQLRDFWDLLGQPDPFDAVEFGSGDGTLGRDVVRYTQTLGKPFSTALRYTEVDRANSDGGATTPVGVTGCVLSNELLDAFPVHRFVIENGSVLELYVVAGEDGFAGAPGPVSDQEIEQRVAPFVSALPDGYRGEVNLGLRPWADRVAATLDRGFVLTVDYGEYGPELYRPGRSEGSLRAYYRHTLSQDPFRHVGDQDLTAHVDFSAVDSALSSAGLDSLGMTTQTAFLDRLGLRSYLARLPALGLPAGEVERNRMPMLWLARPDGLGRFKVAFHARGVAGTRAPIGLDNRGADHDPSTLPVPLLTRDDGHFDLADGAYPGTSWDGTVNTGTWAEILGVDDEGEE
ncbi:MAG: SAM-dependent methyltransferase [Chloroflexi bacterium]|nr:SAM-dependent methyltransferase [Chloroflexota bacterium]